VRCLLDTHILLWAAQGSAMLSDQAKALLEDDASELFFSAASVWEVAIKSGLGRADFRVDAEQLRRGLLANGYEELPVTGEHAVEVASLEGHHKDPFDRILVAQARVERMTLVTADPLMARYAGKIMRV
jgi:PIN domain nuclease of toxin-antitoxin system